MDTASNELTVPTSDSGLTPGTILKQCNNAQNGVSVRNMPEPKKGYQWYVFRASYGREEKANALLDHLQVFTYVPRHTVYIRTRTGVKSTIKKLMPNFVFAYLTDAEARLFTKGPTANNHLFMQNSREGKRDILELNTLISFYYNHFMTGADGMNPPLIIPYQQMKEFFIATRLDKDVIPLEVGTFQVGEEVEVIEGEFKGLTGRVLQVNTKRRRLKIRLTQNGTPSPPPPDNGKRRLLFQLPCLGAFGSASIPTAYFRKIE